MHVEAKTMVKAPKETVSEVYADYRNWPRLFPTISGVRLLRCEGSKLVLEIDHIEGKVINELVVRSSDEIDLWVERAGRPPPRFGVDGLAGMRAVADDEHDGRLVADGLRVSGAG
jgi:hypothetical protein